MTARSIAIGALCLGLAAVCGGHAAAKSLAVCGMLSPNDLRSWWGKDMTVRPAAELPQALGCDWGATDGRGGLLTVRIIPSRYYDEPNLAHDFKPLAGIANKAYVISELGGWRAGALKGKSAVVVQVDGGKSNKNTAVTVLKAIVRQL